MTAPREMLWYGGGKWRAPSGGCWFDSTNPTTGDVWARIPQCSTDDVALAVASASDAFRNGSFARMRATERGRLLYRMADVVRRNAEHLAAIETRDNGKLYAGMVGGLQGWLTDSFDYYAGLADKIEGTVIPVDVPDKLNYTTREPFGVVACITAWNSPLLIAIWKLSAAIAAGNTVVLKPSEYASASTLVLLEVLEQADLPPGLVNVVTGAGADTGEALVRHPDVRLVSFTGGVTGGQAVARAAAEAAKPTILELGGKSPQIVLDDADLDLAVRGIANGIFPPAGQSCIAGSRVLVAEALHDSLVDRLVELVSQARLGDPMKSSTHIGPISNEPHFQRVLAAIDRARVEGAKCVTGGAAVIPKGCNGWFIPPTIFTNVTPEMEVARNEIFGPVLAILPVRDDDHAVAMANDSDFGLAAGIWSRDVLRAMRLATRIEAGTVYINNYFASATQSPVGGFKQSGYGRENGIEGLAAFQQTRSVWLSTNPDEADPFAQ